MDVFFSQMVHISLLCEQSEWPQAYLLAAVSTAGSGWEASFPFVRVFDPELFSIFVGQIHKMIIMAFIDVVKWDGTPDIFAYKFPEENLTTFTQLIVNESQEAVLFRKGKLLQKFSAGKHVLSTENIPLLENFYGIPFGGKNPFTAEVWFVNKVMNLDVKWGTPIPIQLKDPVYGVMVPVRANGQMGIQISDAESFLIKLVGTLPSFNSRNLIQCFRGILLSHIQSSISKKILEEKISLLEISANLLDISQHIKKDIERLFEEYGVKLLNFYTNSISIPEEDTAVNHLKQLLSRKAEMDLLGFNYQEQRSFDVLENASKNEGITGSVMNAGMGLGMGFGVGGAVGGMMQNVNQQVVGKQRACSYCNASISDHYHFCPICGKGIASASAVEKTATTICNKCGGKIFRNSKYCPDCGDLYYPCPTCGADNDENNMICTKCGGAMPKKCPVCNFTLSPGGKFCPECGEKLEKECPNCGKATDSESKYCSTCGTHLR